MRAINAFIHDLYHRQEIIRSGRLPLRVLRAVQFVARFDLELDLDTRALCRTIQLDDLPAERLWGEFEKLLLVAEQPSIGFALARELGVIEQILAEPLMVRDWTKEAASKRVRELLDAEPALVSRGDRAGGSPLHRRVDIEIGRAHV